MFRIVFLTGSLGVLAACGGGGSDPAADDPVVLPAGPPAYRALAEEALDLADRLNGFTDSGDLGIPPAGDASFEGVMLFTDPADGDFGAYTGDFTATYTLASETVDGDATGFFFDGNTDSSVAGTGTAVSGTVTVDGSGISSGLIAVTLGGTLDGTTVVGSGDATFAGPNGEVMLVNADNVGAVGRTTLSVAVIGD